jgi:hypothetical protein
MNYPERFLIGQLGMYGDILYATAIARQMKQDSPKCHITWVVADMFSDVLIKNPYVDAVIGYPISSRSDVIKKWYIFADDMKKLERDGLYDRLFLTQPYPAYPERLRDTIRQSILRGYRFEINVPLTPTLVLTPHEVKNVKAFVDAHKLESIKNVILFETSPGSGQSLVTPEFAMEVSKQLIRDIPGTRVILSGKEPITTNDPAIIDGSVLSYRENAELSHYCTFLIGTSSGITWVCQTDWAKSLPMVQILREGSLASVIADHDYHNLATDNIIEMTDVSVEHVVVCVKDALDNFEDARTKYCEKIVPDFTIVRFNAALEDVIINNRPYAFAVIAMLTAMNEYGPSKELLDFLPVVPKRIAGMIKRKIVGV